MKKHEFISTLQKELQKQNVVDIEDIIQEYEAHYEFKLEDGYSEEEITARLGDPLEIAKQYDQVPSKQTHKPKKAPVVIGLVVLDIFIYSLFISFFLWIVALLAFSTASLGIGFSLFTGVNFNNWIPNMPYWCGAVIAISFVSLAVLSYAGTYYSYQYMRQLHRAYIRTHKNTMAYVNNRPQLPKLASHPQFSKAQARKLRSIFLISLNIFAISFVLGYLVCAINAGSLEFWHVYGWFQ